MFLKPVQNERGLTLIEILSGIVILAIASVLVTSVIGQLFKSESTTNQSISLKRDTNVLINQLRQQYNEPGNDTLCFNHIGDGITVDTVESEISSGEFNESGQCIRGIKREEPFRLKLVTKGKGKAQEGETLEGNQERVEIKTTFNKPKPGEVNYVSTEPPQVSTPNCDSWDDGDVGNELPCLSPGNFEWTGQGFKSGCDEYVVKGDLKKSTTDVAFEGKHVIVNGDLCTVGGGVLDLDRSSYLSVKGDAIIENAFELSDDAEIIINGDGDTHFESEFNIQDNAEMTIKGNAFFGHQFDLQHDAQMIIRGNATFNSDVHINDIKGVRDKEAEAHILGDALFKGPFVLENGAKMTIDSDATFKDTFVLEDGAKLTVSKDAEFNSRAKFNGKNTMAFILGHALFKDEFILENRAELRVANSAEFRGDFTNDSTLCIKGPVIPKKHTGHITDGCDFKLPSK